MNGMKTMDDIDHRECPAGLEADGTGVWRLVAGVAGEMMPVAARAAELLEALRQQERAGDAVEMERLGRLFGAVRSVQAVQRMLRSLEVLGRYSALDVLDCQDRVFVNRLCRTAAGVGDVRADVVTALPNACSVLTDEGALQQMLQSLADQASSRLQRCPPVSGEQRLSLRVELCGQPPEQWLSFTVEDNSLGGPPVAPWQSPGRLELQEWLDLSVCRRIALLLGGSVRIGPAYSSRRCVTATIAALRVQAETRTGTLSEKTD